MRRLLKSKRNFRHAVVTFGILQPTCQIDERGNHEQRKSIVRLEIQIDRSSSTGQGNTSSTEANTITTRQMFGHLVKPLRMPENLEPGVIGRIEFEDGESDSCRLLPTSQISLKLVTFDRIALEVGTGSIVRMT